MDQNDMRSEYEGQTNSKNIRKGTGRPRRDGIHINTGGVEATIRHEDNDLDSDYGASDELNTASESEPECDGVKKKKHIKFPSFNADRDSEDPTFVVGMLFRNKEEFKNACKQWGIKNRYQLHFLKNNLVKVRCECYDKCGFWIYACKLNKHDPDDHTFQLRTLNLKHKCAKKHKNFHVTSKWLAQKYIEDFRIDPTWKLNAFIERVKKDLKTKIVKMKAWRARDYALKAITGDEKEQYSKLYEYRKEILRTNPGTTMEFKEPKGAFEGVYVCIDGLKKAVISGCRPLVCLDGCWLKGKYGGQLLSATVINPNDCIYPFAWAVVKTESAETWTWFLELLKDDLEMYNSHHWVLMSDRQKVSTFSLFA